MRFCRLFWVFVLLVGFGGPWGVVCQAQAPESSGVSVHLLRGSLSKTETAELDLAEALRMAAADNPLVQAEADLVSQARARYQTRLAEMLPDLELSYQQAHYDGAIQTFGDEVINVQRDTYQPQLLFRFPIFQGGRRYFQVRSAKRQLQAQEATAHGTLQQTLRQTALNYYELKRRLEEIAIAQKQLEETREQLKINQIRLDTGVGTRLDVLQSEGQVARAHQQLLEAVRASQVAALRLNEILNLPAMVSVVPEESGQQMQTLVPTDAEFLALLALAKANRPELKALVKQIEAMEELRKVVWSAVLPEVALQYRTGGVGSTFGNIRGYDEGAYALAFQFRSLAAPALTRYKENTAQLLELRHRLQAMENTIERELSEAYLQALTRQAQTAVARTELTATEQALSDAVERLKAGVGRNIDVLDAETALTRARVNLSNTVLEYNQAQVDLVYLMGQASIESLTQGIPLP